MIFRVSLLLGLSMLALVVQAQKSFSELSYQTRANDPDWVQLMYQSDADPGEVIRLYRQYYNSNNFEKNQHTQFFKRWLRQLDRGEAVPADMDAWRTQRDARLAAVSTDAKARMGGGWTCIGPFDFDIDAPARSYAPGAAHVYTVEQASTNTDVLYAGTANAGIWRTDDKGLSWYPLTDQLLLASVRALEIDHSNEDVLYAGGAGAVWKTTDGGFSWNEMGDPAFLSLYHDIEDIVMSPFSSSEIYVSSNHGFYRSVDGGVTFSQTLAEDIQEIELHPTNASIIYCVVLDGTRTRFYKSNDFGLTFTEKPAGWPAPLGGEEQRRTEISVNPAEPDRVVALATGEADGGSGLFGIYQSIDAGESWTFSCCGSGPGGVPTPSNPNIMHWDTDGLTSGGQYYYDLALAVEPISGGDILTGGINIWRSSDGGSTFVNNAHWTIGSAGDQYVHADVHDIRFFGTDLWVASDGGIYYSDDAGNTFEKRMNGIAGTDFWGFGAGHEDPSVMIGGTYHNGTLLKDGDVYQTGWISMLGGDNFRGFVNYGAPRTVYDDGGKLRLPGDRLEPLGHVPYDKLPNASYIVGESSEIAFDPRSWNHAWTGNDAQLWKTTRDGAGFQMIHDFGTGKVTSIAPARTDIDRIYVALWTDWWGSKELYRTEDGGSSWINITPSSSELGGNLWAPFDVEVSSDDPDLIWITRCPMSGNYNNLDGNKVYRSTDGGDTWENWTTSTLDGQYPTNIFHQRGTDGVYLGTRTGVWYRNGSMTDWALYTTGLPARTHSVRLQPDYRNGMIRNGTNRSVWEIAFYEASALQAQISADRLEVSCLRDTVHFMEYSAGAPAGSTFSWSFPGGTPSSSTDRRPAVTYATSGSYSVSLTVTEPGGETSTQMLDNMITVVDECTPDGIPGRAAQMLASGDMITVPSLEMTPSELTFTAWIKPDGVQPDYTGIVMHSSTGAGLNFRPGMELAYHWPNGQWWWSSGLVVPENEWSHVAFVMKSSGVTVYLNGASASDNFTPDLDAFGELLLGSYQGWGSRNYSGLIDEVTVWDRALTSQEIRLLRHLTQVPTEAPSLIAYYQFNRAEGEITDRVGTRHAVLNGNAVRTNSTVPVGMGVSERMWINSASTWNFAEPGIRLSWNPGRLIPSGEMVVSRIDVSPDITPGDSDFEEDMGGSYWIMNSYSGVPSWDAPDNLEVLDYGPINPAMSWFHYAFRLNTRAENADGPVWEQGNTASDVIAGDPGEIDFGRQSDLNQGSQMAVVFNNSIIGAVEDPRCCRVDVWPNPAGDWSRVSWDEAMPVATVELVDLMGRIQQVTVSEDQFAQFNNLQPGWYNVRLLDQKGMPLPESKVLMVE